MRQGRCTNFGNCGVADRREIVTAPPGQDLICPECRRALSEIEAGSRGPSPLWVVAFLVLLLGFGYAAYLFLHRSPVVKNTADSTSIAPPLSPKPASADVVLRLHGSNTSALNWRRPWPLLF